MVTVGGFDVVNLRVKVLLYLTYESFAVGRCLTSFFVSDRHLLKDRLLLFTLVNGYEVNMSPVLEVILGVLVLVTGRSPESTSCLCGAIFPRLSPSLLGIASSARDILDSSCVMILIFSISQEFIYTACFIVLFFPINKVAEPGFESMTYKLISTAGNVAYPLATVLSQQLLSFFPALTC